MYLTLILWKSYTERLKWDQVKLKTTLLIKTSHKPVSIKNLKIENKLLFSGIISTMDCRQISLLILIEFKRIN